MLWYCRSNSGISLMVEHQFSKLRAGVRFSYPAQSISFGCYHEGMRQERFPKIPNERNHSESTALELPIMEIEKIGRELQARLALLVAYGRHSDLDIDIAHPGEKGSEIRGLAMGEWVAGDDAANFRNYLEDPHYAGKFLDPVSATELRKLLSSIRDKGTLH